MGNCRRGKSGKLRGTAESMGTVRMSAHKKGNHPSPLDARVESLMVCKGGSQVCTLSCHKVVLLLSIPSIYFHPVAQSQSPGRAFSAVAFFITYLLVFLGGGARRLHRAQYARIVGIAGKKGQHCRSQGGGALGLRPPSFPGGPPRCFQLAFA